MSIDITWKIDDMKRNTETGGVSEVFWTVWATREEKYVTEINGVIELTPDPASDSFIAYESLTEDNVIAWVHGVLDKDTVEQEARNKLNKLHPLLESAPAEASGTPWSSN